MPKCCGMVFLLDTVGGEGEMVCCYLSLAITKH